MALSRKNWSYALLVMAIAILVSTVMLFYTQRLELEDAATAEANLRAFCIEHGGYLSLDLVDGVLWIHLENAHLEQEDMLSLKRLWNRCVSHDLGDPAVVHLYLSHARLNGDLAEILDDRVVGLTLTGLPIDDATIGRIVENGPRVNTLVLNNTRITDKSLHIIRRLPLQELSVCDTAVSYAGLSQLVECPHLYSLTISSSSVSQREQKRLRKLLTCDVFVSSDGK